MTPYFSIIVPVYQAERTLERCVRSVLNQDCEDYEMLLIDDGSTDHSRMLCDVFAKEDSRIKVIHQPNSGVSAARNAGLRVAKGKYLLFLDSDDALFPEALEVYVSAAEKGNADVIFGGVAVLENGEQTRSIGFDADFGLGAEIWEEICRNPEPFGYVGGKLIRRQTIRKEAVFFDERMRSQEDLDFFLSVYSVSESFYFIAQQCYMYYYAPPKRTPPFWDFISNQIKILKNSTQHRELSSNARQSVLDRIVKLLYTALYCAAEDGNVSYTVDKLIQIEGLNEYLVNAPAKGEYRLVARSFAAGRFRFIRFYFMIRNIIRDLVRWIRKR